MIRNYLLLWLFGISACILAGTDGREAIDGGIIVTKANEFPYQVSVRVHSYNHSCGGGIISKICILSAAHCVVSKGHIVNSGVTVLAKTHDLQRTDPPALIAQVKKVFVPEEYFNARHNNVIGDIAVLRLLSEIRLSFFNGFYTLNWREGLAEPGMNITSEEALIAGWGRSRQLRYAEARVLDHRQCQGTHHRLEINDDTILCAQVIDRRVRGVCHGDEGGPLVVSQFAIGILSKAADDCDETSTPAIYTRVSHYHLLITSAQLDRQHDDIRTKILPARRYSLINTILCRNCN